MRKNGPIYAGERRLCSQEVGAPISAAARHLLGGYGKDHTRVAKQDFLPPNLGPKLITYLGKT